MRSKQEIFDELSTALNAGTITRSDIETFMSVNHTSTVITSTDVITPEKRRDKLSAVDTMFYIAGIVLFVAITTMIAQSWGDGNSFLHIFLSAGLGTLLWGVAYYLISSRFQNEIRRGLTNSLLLTGSLLMITGGYITTNELVSGFNEINFIPIGFGLLIVGGLHLSFDRFINKDLLLLMGVFLCVAAFPSFLFGIIKDADTPIDIWVTILVLTSGLLAYATRVVSRMNPERPFIHDAFDGFAAFLAMMSMYVASYSDYGFLWLITLIGSILGIFYLSIVLQNKHLLGTGSFFLVLTIVTVCFKYFSGFGATTSLILSALGLLASAAIASSINKKYFPKQPQNQTE